MTPRKAVLLVIGGIACALAWLAFRSDPSVPPVALTGKPDVTALPSLARLAGPASEVAATQASGIPGDARSATVNTGRARNDFAQRLLTATNIRDFVLDALKQPAKGGAFYATQALYLCGTTEVDKDLATQMIQVTVEKESTITPGHMAAIGALTARCEGFSTGEDDALREEAERLGSSGRDPLMALTLAAREAKSHEEYLQLVPKILARGDLQLMAATSLPFKLLSQVANHDSDINPLGPRFNGKAIPGTDNFALDTATLLATCVDGEFCTADQFNLSNCSNSARCYEKRDDYILESMFSGNKVAYERSVAYAKVMREALLRGDLTIFK